MQLARFGDIKRASTLDLNAAENGSASGGTLSSESTSTESSSTSSSSTASTSSSLLMFEPFDDDPLDKTSTVEARPSYVRAVIYACVTISASVSLVSMDKYIFRDLGWPHVATLTSIHFVCTAIFSRLVRLGKAYLKTRQHAAGMERRGLGAGGEIPRVGSQSERVVIPRRYVLIYAAVNVTCVLSLNASLAMNPMYLYQTFKVLIAPLVAVGQWLFLKKPLSSLILVSLAITSLGAFIVATQRETPEEQEDDMSVSAAHSFIGLIVGLCSILFASVGAVVTGFMMSLPPARPGAPPITSMDLLEQSFIPATAFMVLAIPFMDDTTLLLSHAPSPFTVFVICVSCCAAFIVNLMIAVVIGLYSPLAYQFIGHAKTILVTLSSLLLFGDSLSSSQTLGLGCTATGVAIYSYDRLRT